MAKFYYNGTLLPELPSGMLASYPYAFLYINATEPIYRLCMSKSKYFYQSSDNTIQPGSNTVKNYWLTTDQVLAGDTWVHRDDTVYYWGPPATAVKWSNYNIPKGSASGTETFFYGSHLTQTPIHIVQRWNASIGNNIFELNLTMDGCTPGNTLILAYVTRANDNVITLSDGWTVLGGGNNASDPGDSDQRIWFAYKKVNTASESIRITQSIGKRIYTVCAEYAGVGKVVMRNDLGVIGTTNYTVVGKKTNNNDVMLYAVTSAYYGSGRNQTVTPADLDKLEGDSSAERLACWFDGGLGALSHTFQSFNSTEPRDAVLECVQLFEIVPEFNIYGNTVGQSVPQTDWLQEDKNQADFLKNKPQGVMQMPAYTEADYGKVLTLTADGLAWVEQSGGISGDFINVEEVAM